MQLVVFSKLKDQINAQWNTVFIYLFIIIDDSKSNNEYIGKLI